MSSLHSQVAAQGACPERGFQVPLRFAEVSLRFAEEDWCPVVRRPFVEEFLRTLDFHLATRRGYREAMDRGPGDGRLLDLLRGR